MQLDDIDLTALPDDNIRQLVLRLWDELTDLSRQRYQVHRAALHRVRNDLLPAEGRPTQRLERWWELDFAAFLAEVKKAGGPGIPVAERADWERYLQSQAREYQRLCGEIIAGEKALDRQVYALYDLGPAEIAQVEQATGYGYGET